MKNFNFVNFKRFKFNSIFFRNFMIILALELCVLGVLTYNYTGRINENAVSEVKEKNYSELERTGDILDTVIRQLSDWSYYVSSSTKLNFFELSDGDIDRYENMKSIRDYIVSCEEIFEYVHSANVYVEKLNWVISRDSASDLSSAEDRGWVEMYEEIPDKKGTRPYYLMSRSKGGTYPFLLTMIYPVYDGKKEKKGAIVIDIDIEMLNQSLGWDDDDSQKLYLVDDTGKLLYSSVSRAVKYPELLPADLNENLTQYLNDPNGFNSRNVKNDKYIVAVTKADSGGYYIMYSPGEYYQESLNMVRQFAFRNVIVMFVSGIVISLVLATHSYNPIRRIMNEIESGEGLKEEEAGEESTGKRYKYNELQYITGMIRNAKRKNVALKMETDEWVRRLERAQVQALQNQINPHFLYNTLDSINWMVMEKLGKDNTASGAICTLSALFRMSVKKDDYLIALEEELEHAKLYLELLHIRYPDRIKVHFEIGEDLLSMKVIRFCLQPIIENAVKHGLKSRRYNGDIYIKGDYINTTLIIRVEDNGEGMSREECIRTNQILSKEYHIVDDHVGIKNVNQRMKILFGDDYGIQLRPRENEGLVVILCFPGDL